MKVPSISLSVIIPLLMCTPLSAANWFVDDDAAPAGDGMAWGTAFDNLQDALAAASSGDFILVARGTYFPDVGGTAVNDDRNETFQLKDGVEIYGGFPNGGGSRNLAAHRTILSGDIDGDDVDAPSGGNSYSVVTGSGTDATAVLDGCIVTRGLAEHPTDPAFGETTSGAGVFVSGGSPTFRNCVFTNNSAIFGGGVFNVRNDLFVGSSPSFVNCLFSGNKATGFGGGLNNRQDCDPILVSCTFSANSADSNGGGGAISNFNADPSLTNCIIWNNEENGSTTTVQASVNDSNSTTGYEYCLVQNLDPSGTNLDGTLASNDPDFLIPGDPTLAPSRDGEFRLETGSPALDVGDNTANSETGDLIGNPRIDNVTIDLGAYEGAFTPVIVDTLHVDQSIGVPGDGSSWAQAFATLQDALDGAVSGQMILVAGGTYYPDEGSGVANNDRGATYGLRNGVSILGGYPNGGGARNFASNPTILSGDIDKNDAGAPSGGNSYTVVTASGRDSTAVIDGFIIEGGLADSGVGDFDTPPNAGGGIFIDEGSPTVLNCIIRGNFGDSGGGVFVTGTCSPVFTNCVVSGNSTGGFGGGFQLRSNADALITNTTFSGNSAGTNGGAMSTFQVNPQLSNCIIWNNQAAGSTGTAGASVLEGLAAVVSYDFCLVENLTPGGTNLDGTNAGNDPQFVAVVNPATAPTTSGDLSLGSASPLRDSGDSAANAQAIDVLGNDRVSNGIIDLGAYEFVVPVLDTDGDGLSDDFELEHTDPSSNISLLPGSNEDNDPFTALEEFAFGLDPNVANGNLDAFSFAIIEESLMDYLSITWNVNPAAIAYLDIVPEQSFDLGLTDAWSNGDTAPLSAPLGMASARSTSPVSASDEDFLRLEVIVK
ncbi:MAG: right-handed parallel beta-helix repeat-containing protein [Verrucomicrobiota bacterium]